jgi:hypothetical protein
MLISKILELKDILRKEKLSEEDVARLLKELPDILDRLHDLEIFWDDKRWGF